MNTQSNTQTVTEPRFRLNRNANWVMSQKYDGSKFDLVVGDSALISRDSSSGVHVITIPGSGINFEQLGRALAQRPFWTKEGGVLNHKHVAQQRHITNAGDFRFEVRRGIRSNDGWKIEANVHPIVALCDRRNRTDNQTINKWALTALLLQDNVRIRIECRSFKAARDYIIKGFRQELAVMAGHNKRGYVTSKMARFGAKKEA